ncbi:MAG: hypothetical protein CV045_12410, partial [Cyanobacteria bacterium M5B4]
PRAQPCATRTAACGPPPAPLAITGMAAHFGQYPSLDAFAAALYSGAQDFRPLPETRWKGLQPTVQPPLGAWLAGFDFDFRRFRLPPLPADQVIPQHLLLLHVADAAIQDAGLPAGGNVAVLVAMSTEMALHQFRGRVDLAWQLEQSLAASGLHLSDAERERLTQLARESLHTYPQVNQYTSFIGNVIASRVAAHHDFTGPAFTVSDEGASVLRALDLARLLLHSDPTLEAVVVGAVDLTGGLERLTALHQHAPLHRGDEPPSFSFAVHSTGWLPGEGAGAVVVRRLADVPDSQRVYACLDGLAIVQQPTPTPAALVAAIEQAHAQCGTCPTDTGYLELSATGNAACDAAEAAAIVQAYPRAATHIPTCALGSVTATIGYTGAAAGMASLIRTALALHERYIPAVPNWQAPRALADWGASGLYVADRSRAWFARRKHLRRAALNVVTPTGTHAHILLSEAPQPHFSGRIVAQLAPALLVLGGDDHVAILAQLDQLSAALANQVDLAALARQSYAQWNRQRPRYTLSLVASTPDELRREIERAHTGVVEAFASPTDAWKTPAGSYFTAQPQGIDGKVAFVYPGAFNAYVGLGQHLFPMFPELHEQLHTMVSDPGAMLGEHLLYPRSMHRLSSAELKAHEAQMLSESIAMLEIGSSIGAAYTHLLRHSFKVQPEIVFGYSQGETAMFQILGVWRDGDACSAALRGSDLYRTRLAGPKQAVREFWGPSTAGISDDDLWANYILMTSAAAVLPHLADEPRVYLAIITAPREVMIAGDPAGCQRVIRKVGCRSLRTPFGQVIHSPPITSEYAEFVRINTFPVEPPPGITFYSAATYAPLTITSEAVAHSAAQVFCNQLDFPRLVERVYADGARVFIELGAARTCSRWIEAILGNRPHTALAINKKGTDDQIGIVRLLAQLASHGVALDLAPLYHYTSAPSAVAGALVRHVLTGGVPLATQLANAAPEPFVVQRVPVVSPSPAPEQASVPEPFRAYTNGHAHPEAQPTNGTRYTPSPASPPDTPLAPLMPTPRSPIVATLALEVEEEQPMQPLHSEEVAVGVAPDLRPLMQEYQQTVQDTAMLETRAHAALLEARQQAFARLATLVRGYHAAAQPATPVQVLSHMPPAMPSSPTSHHTPEPPAAGSPTTLTRNGNAPALHTPVPFTPRYSTPSNVVWNEADLLEF